MTHLEKAWTEPGHVNQGATNLDDDLKSNEDPTILQPSSSSAPSPSSSAPFSPSPQPPGSPNHLLKKVKANRGSSGCLDAFKRGLLHIWATRQTLDFTNNKDLKIKTTIRELIIYCIFVAVICVMTFGMVNPLTFCYTNVLDILFIQTPADPSNPGSNFLGMNLHSDFFDYVEKNFLHSLYQSWETVYNGNPTPPDSYGFIYYENKLQGVPRIRQVRVKNNSCLIPEDFQSQIKACYASYSQLSVDTKPFGLLNGSAWTYSSQEQLKGSSVTAEVNSYDGGGFYLDLNTTTEDSLEVIKILKENLWVDRATRAVFIDFTVYNANINLFCSIKLIAEFPPTGGIINSYIFRPTKLIRYNNTSDFIILAFEIAFCVFVVYYIIEEIIELKKLGFSYLKEFWNILDIVVLLMALCCIAFNVYCYFAVKKHLDLLFLKPDAYVDFDFLTYWQMIFNAALAVMVFFAWIKIFKYIGFSRTMSQLSLTLGASSKDLAGFSVMFFIIFLAFSQLGYLMFGTQVADFNTFSNSIFTLFRIILGDFNFQALQQANRILGPLYFILYVFFVFFVLLNMFLAIINDTYAEVKADLANKPSEIDMKKFFKERANRLLEKLHLKRKKLVEMEEAIGTADTNNDKIIDFNEWRKDLRARGYADDEIESVFSKYDKSGDRVLDEDELRKLQADLTEQKLVLSKNISKMDAGDSKKEEDGYHTDDGDDRSDTSSERFAHLKKRVEKLENSIGSISSRINTVLIKLEAMENAKVKRRENIGRVIDDIAESNDLTEDMAQQEVEKVVGEEFERWREEPFAKNRII